MSQQASSDGLATAAEIAGIVAGIVAVIGIPETRVGKAAGRGIARLWVLSPTVWERTLRLRGVSGRIRQWAWTPALLVLIGFVCALLGAEVLLDPTARTHDAWALVGVVLVIVGISAAVTAVRPNTAADTSGQHDYQPESVPIPKTVSAGNDKQQHLVDARREACRWLAAIGRNLADGPVSDSVVSAYNAALRKLASTTGDDFTDLLIAEEALRPRLVTRNYVSGLERYTAERYSSREVFTTRLEVAIDRLGCDKS